jgi:hypothetical protein
VLRDSAHFEELIVEAERRLAVFELIHDRLSALRLDDSIAKRLLVTRRAIERTLETIAVWEGQLAQARERESEGYTRGFA